jgi:hypothetical protein
VNPEVEILSVVKVNWPAFKSTTSEAQNMRPDTILAQCPVPLSEDAEFLIHLAYLSGIPIDNPLNVLRTLPHHLLDYLHYTMMIACDNETRELFMSMVRLQIVVVRRLEYNILLVTGPLSEWYNTATISKYNNFNLRVLIDKVILLFEKQGLKQLFARFEKRQIGDGTFALEYKK